MNQSHKPRWTVVWWANLHRRQLAPGRQIDDMFDPHSLSGPNSEPQRWRFARIAGYVLLAAAPAIYLLVKTYPAASVYYQPVYAGILSLIVAGVFGLEVATQFHLLLTRPPANDTPLATRLVRFCLATGIYFAIVFICSQFCLLIENYWLFFAVGYYSPYLVHHILLIILLSMTWSWFEKLAQNSIRPKDRQPISGRTVTHDDEAQRRRQELFR